MPLAQHKPTKPTRIQAFEMREQADWERLDSITVEESIFLWLESLQSKHTQANYTSAMKRLVELGFIDISLSLQQLALIARNSMIDQVKQVKKWSEATKQARAAAMLSFFRFLNRRTDGLIKRLHPSKEGESKTFYKIRDEVVTPAMTQSQWTRWLDELEKMNSRDALIAKIILQGGKRVGEVLSLQVDQIDFELGEITFVQSKSRTERKTIISYPETLMRELKDHLGGRKGQVFITSGKKPVTRKQVAYTFACSGKRAGLDFLIRPHVLRASTITFLKGQGYSDSEIRLVTGHASSDMVAAYDRRSKADNISKKIYLVK